MPSKYLHFCLSKKKVTIFEPKVEGRSHGSRRARPRWVTRKSFPRPRVVDAPAIWPSFTRGYGLRVTLLRANDGLQQAAAFGTFRYSQDADILHDGRR